VARKSGSSTSEKKWETDENGIQYYVEGNVKYFKTREDRDAHVEEKYRLSPVMQTVIGDRRSDSSIAPSMPTLIHEHLAAIVEVYQGEAERYHGALREKVRIWSMKHFGVVEPVVEQMIAAEVKRRMSEKERHELFGSYREQERWEKAARRMMSDPQWQALEGHEQKAGWIAGATGWKPADFRVKPIAKSMPRLVKYLDEKTYNERMETLRAQAAGIQREESEHP
jgi:hypothetical protein